MSRVKYFAALAAIAPLAFAGSNDAPVMAPVPAPVPAGAYTVDKAHTSLLFKVSHLGFSTYTGRFTQVDARLRFNPDDFASSSVTVNIDPRSIQADNAPSGFMQTLAGKDCLDADRFGQMTFKSTAVEVTGPRSFRIRGDLTLHGVTRPITLDAVYNGGYAGFQPYEPRARVGFSAQGSFKRSDFGVNYGIPAPGTTFGVGDEVHVVLETEFSGPALATAQR